MAFPPLSIKAIQPGCEAFSIKCRIINLWYVYPSKISRNVFSIEFIVTDEEGDKIHISVPKHNVDAFIGKLVEGNVYEISSFSVAPNRGSYRTTLHSFRLVLRDDTILMRSSSDLIPLHSLSLTSSKEFYTHRRDHDFLIDVLGYMTGISMARELFLDGKVCKVHVADIFDERGKIGCVFYGELCEQLKKFAEGSAIVTPIVFRFVKVKMFRDNPTIEFVPNVTKILVDPDISEVRSFKYRMHVIGFDCTSPMNVLCSIPNETYQEDLLQKYPRKTIEDLKTSADDGDFVVVGSIADFVNGENWWFPSSDCTNILNRCSRSTYCTKCVLCVLPFKPKYRVKIRVFDITGEAVFILHNNQVQNLIKKGCSEFVEEGQVASSSNMPAELLALKGTTFIFKVEKKKLLNSVNGGCFNVRKICGDIKPLESVCGTSDGS